MTNTNLLRIIGEKLTKILLNPFVEMQENIKYNEKKINICLLYTSDAADDYLTV